MPFNPTEAWVSIGRLAGGESSHHTSLKVIQMRLPSGNLAENDEENVSVFANHFKKVLNNHKTTDTTLIIEINLQEVMGELDNPPLWPEYIRVIQELTNDKSPGLNGAPPERLQVHDRGKPTPLLQLHHRILGGKSRL